MWWIALGAVVGAIAKGAIGAMVGAAIGLSVFLARKERNAGGGIDPELLERLADVNRRLQSVENRLTALEARADPAPKPDSAAAAPPQAPAWRRTEFDAPARPSAQAEFSDIDASPPAAQPAALEPASSFEAFEIRSAAPAASALDPSLAPPEQPPPAIELLIDQPPAAQSAREPVAAAEPVVPEPVATEPVTAQPAPALARQAPEPTPAPPRARALPAAPSPFTQWTASSRTSATSASWKPR